MAATNNSIATFSADSGNTEVLAPAESNKGGGVAASAAFADGGDSTLRRRRRPGAVATKLRGWRGRAEEEEDINEVADAFIRRFREHLLLQRLQSIEDYNHMLARGM